MECESRKLPAKMFELKFENALSPFVNARFSFENRTGCAKSISSVKPFLFRIDSFLTPTIALNLSRFCFYLNLEAKREKVARMAPASEVHMDLKCIILLGSQKNLNLAKCRSKSRGGILVKKESKKTTRGALYAFNPSQKQGVPWKI